MAAAEVDAKQLQKATVSLKRYLGEQGGNKLLADDDEFIYLVLSLKKSHPLHRKDKPIRIAIPHPIYEFEDASICLFVKDDRSGQGHKDAKKQLERYSGKAGISKVVGTSKLRTKFESYEAKRNLCRQYDLFLADDRVLPSLPKLIGKQFFRKKKQPIPINLTCKDWEAQFKAARTCTTMALSGGSCISIKVARASFTDEQVIANIAAVLECAALHIPKKWPNVQAVFLKSSDSVALPVYQCLPERSHVIT